MPYPRTVEELKENAVIYWPSEIAEKERNSSIIPLLLATQDHFISVYSILRIEILIFGLNFCLSQMRSIRIYS